MVNDLRREDLDTLSRRFLRCLGIDLGEGERRIDSDHTWNCIYGRHKNFCIAGGWPQGGNIKRREELPRVIIYLCKRREPKLVSPTSFDLY